MVFWQSFVIALGMLKLHKLRAFLTMLGVIIGVMSVTIIVMLSEGFQAYIKNQFASIGSDTIFLSFDAGRLRRGQSMGSFEGLKLTDIDYLLERCDSIRIASGYRMMGSQQARAGDVEVKNVSIEAADGRFLEVNNITMAKGRKIQDQDNEQMSNVAIVNENLAKELFPGKDPLGQWVQLPGLTLQIVGVYERVEMMGQREPRTLVMPLATANKKWLGGDRVDLVLIKAKPGVNLDDAMQEVWEALMAKSGNRPIYRVESSENILKIFQGVIGVAGAVLAGIAALSLLVGGIGIMNIMLVSVTERTREIGLRKAVGAKRPAILFQFLIEAGTLSLVGGLIGMGIAYSLGSLVTVVSMAREWPDKNGLATPFPVTAALGAAAFSALIGMVFGFYPAVSAAKLDPIVALRHE